MPKYPYKAVNRLSFKGRAVGRSYTVIFGSTRKSTEAEARKINARWNKRKASVRGNYKAKLIKVVKR